MNRLDQRRRRALRAVAPVAGLLAAGLLVWQGSSAAFSATTQQRRHLDHRPAGAHQQRWHRPPTPAPRRRSSAQPSAQQNLKPGSTDTKCLTVESTGTLAGTLSSSCRPSPATPACRPDPPDHRRRSRWRRLRPTSPRTAPASRAPARRSVANAVALSALPTSYAGATTSIAVAAGTQRVAYRFAWTFATTGTTADNDPAGQDDAAATSPSRSSRTSQVAHERSGSSRSRRSGHDGGTGVRTPAQVAGSVGRKGDRR